jgi:pyruvate dehydrogenase E2 component (dihydrolipoyllysine-residue acetyltransferase)
MSPLSIGTKHRKLSVNFLGVPEGATPVREKASELPTFGKMRRAIQSVGGSQMIDFKMPQLGETVLEATITKWLKKEGDSIQEDEPLVEVSTDKVDSEIPSPASGTVARILAQEGDTVEVGAVLAEIGSASDGPQSREQTDGKVEPRPAPAAAPRRSDSTDVAPPPARPAAQEAATSARRTPDQDFRGVLSPLVRRLAAEHQVELESVTGTGAGGRITKQDILRYAGNSSRDKTTAPAREDAPPAPAPPPPAAAASAEPARAPLLPGGAEEVVQVSPMRRAIAEHMLASMTQTARAWNTIEIDLGRVAQLRAVAGPAFKQHEGFSLTWMPFVCKAVTQALLKFPQLNSTWNGDGTITRKNYVNLGIAVALENGLIVPVIKGAEGMNLVGLARGIRDIADRARGKKLTPDDVQGGTFTVTNPGGFGSIMSVPIINRGQAAILSFDAVVKRPVVVKDDLGQESVGIRPMTFLSISWDHRIIDGAEAAQFLAYLKSLLEEADFESDLGGLLPSVPSGK